MSGKENGASREPFVMLPRELLASDAWRSLGINARRLVDFLMLEHMAHGGKQNGKLHAPHRQLAAFGLWVRRLADNIREAEELGLVDCYRSGMRVATRYALTWLPLHDGAPASNRWRTYRNPDLAPLPAPKSRNLPDKGKAGLPDKGKADGPNLPDKGKADTPENLPDKGNALLRRSYQDGDDSLGREGEGAAPAAGGAGTPSALADVVPLSRARR